MKLCFKFMLIFIGFLLCSNVGMSQSEHAKKIAQTFASGKHSKYAKDILVTKPDFVIFAPKQELEKRGDTYNDHFQVFDKPDGKLFAVWTQASREGNHDHHIAFSRSYDHGLTWSEPQVLAGSENKINPKLKASWQQPMVSKTGRIYVFWNQQVSNTLNHHCGEMFGCFSDNNGDSWSPPRKVTFGRTTGDTGTSDPTPVWCNWQRPLRLGEDGRYLVASSRHRISTHYELVTEYIQFENIDDNPPVEKVQLRWFCEGEKALTWPKEMGPDHKKIAQKTKVLDPSQLDYSDAVSVCEESSIVKLPDGRLFSIMRTAAGYPVWSVSSDQGKSWAPPKPLRDRDGGKVYQHPRSPCPIYDRKGPEAGSGYYFTFVHNNTYGGRGPLYLLAGKYQPNAEQPVWFAPSQLFINRPQGNSLYASSTLVNGKVVLWYNDLKFFLLGRYIGDEWFKYWDEK